MEQTDQQMEGGGEREHTDSYQSNIVKLNIHIVSQILSHFKKKKAKT